MDTVRVDVCYRPLRIAWAIREGDVEAFRRAVRLSHALWGGQFNCIVIADREEQATQLIELFRVDLIVPLGDSEEIRAFAGKFRHIINPLFHDDLFIPGSGRSSNSAVLDVHNLFATIHETTELSDVRRKGVRTYSWNEGDPLADAFRMLLGEYPPLSESHTHYASLIRDACDATEEELTTAPIPASVLEHYSIADFSRHGVAPHYSIPSGWAPPGFYVGDAADLQDLHTFWNLRAANIPLWFVDPNHLDRFAEIIPAWESRVRHSMSHGHDFEKRVTIWSRMDAEEAARPFSSHDIIACPVSATLWNGANVRPPMMQLGETTTLGVISSKYGRPKVSFGLIDKPFIGDHWFGRQHLVTSVSFLGGLFGDERHTLRPPFLPELNEFLGRSMRFDAAKLRIEPERIGLVVDAADSDASLNALPVADLVERVFGLAKLTARPNAAGNIARQLIANLGGLQGARALKIPGVRRLLKTHGPTAAFTKKAALQMIGGRDGANPEASFADHAELRIEGGQPRQSLTPQSVFSYLVDKGILRIGLQLSCPACRLSSWVPVDDLKQQAKCDLCGHAWNATRQLVDEEWHYRRSGALGVERNSLGSVPVALTLQQLDANLHAAFDDDIYSTALDLVPHRGRDEPPCEVDFVWIIPRSLPRRTVVMLGECKDQGQIDSDTIDNLRRCADALPSGRLKTFVVLSKLCPFTPDEILLAKTLNDDRRQRVIMLTAQELEPYHIYDRAEKGTDHLRTGTPEDLAQATAHRYFLEASD